MEIMKKKLWKRFLALLLMGAMVFSAFPMTVYGKTSVSDSAERLPVYIKHSNGESVLAKVYTLDEIEALCEENTVFFSSIDSMNAPVLTAVKGVTVDSLIAQITGDLQIEGSDISKISMSTTDGGSSATIYDIAQDTETGYFFPGLFTDDQITSETDTQGILDQGGTQVEPMIAVESYQDRIAYLKTQTGLTDLDEIKSWVTAKMDSFATFRYCFGQTESDILNREVTTSSFSKWLYKMTIMLNDPPGEETDQLQAPDFTITQSEDGAVIYVRIKNNEPDATLCYSVNSGDNSDDFTGYIPQTEYTGRLEFRRDDLTSYTNNQVHLKAMASEIGKTDSDTTEVYLSNKTYDTESLISSYDEFAEAVAASVGEDVITLGQGFEWTGTLDITGKEVSIENGTEADLTIISAKSTSITGEGVITFDEGINFAGKNGEISAYPGLKIKNHATVTVNGNVEGSLSSTGQKTGVGLYALDSTVVINGVVSGATQASDSELIRGNGANGIVADGSKVTVNGNVWGGDTKSYGSSETSYYGGTGIEAKNGSKIIVVGNVSGGEAPITFAKAYGGMGLNLSDSKADVAGNITGGSGYHSIAHAAKPYNPGCMLSGDSELVVRKSTATGGGNINGGNSTVDPGGAGVWIYSGQATVEVEGNVTGGSSTDSYAGPGLMITSDSDHDVTIAGDISSGQDDQLFSSENENYGISLPDGINGKIEVGGNVTGKGAGISIDKDGEIVVGGNVTASLGTGIIASGGAITVEGDVTGAKTGIQAVASTVDTAVEVEGDITGTAGYGALAAQAAGYNAGITYKGTVTGGVAATADDAAVKAILGDNYAVGTYKDEASGSGSWSDAANTSWYNSTDTSFDIATPEQLAGLAAIVNGAADGISQDNFTGKTISLTSDIRLNDHLSSAQDGSALEWTSIGGGVAGKTNGAAFNGTFEGNGYTIQNLYIYSDESSSSYVGRNRGLFGITDKDAVIRNLAITGYVHAQRGVGAFVGKTGSGGTGAGTVIENCANYAAVSGTDSKGYGGIVGSAWNAGMIKNCYNAGTVSTAASYPAGGIAGELEISMVNCYNVGTVTAAKASYAGALTATLKGGTITNCYYLDGSAAGGGVAYVNSGTTDGAISKSSAEMKTSGFTATLNAGGSAFVADKDNLNNGYPVLSWQSKEGGDSADITSLTKAIGAATANKGTVTVSKDGNDVSTSKQWVTESVMEAYSNAIATAQAIADDTNAAQTEIDNAVSLLETATNTFNHAKAYGKKSSGNSDSDNSGGSGGGGGGGGGDAENGADIQKGSSGVQKAVVSTNSTAKTDSSGKAKAAVSSSTLNSALEQASKAAEDNDKKAGSKAGTTAVEVKVQVKGTANAKAVETTLPSDTLKEMSEQKNTLLTVSSSVADITLDQDALEAITDKAGEQVTISAEKVDGAALPEAARQEIGDAPVYDLKILGSKGTIADFKGGKATVSVPYELKDGESASQVAVYYINDAGELVKMKCTFDPATKTATFTTDHFSYYAVVIESENTSFADVKKTAYYYDAVSFAVKKGLFNGTTSTTFSPDTGMTRAMFITALGRANGVNAASYEKTNFSDVKTGSWYGSYVQWAFENKIISGMGEGKFAPDQQITRAQMAVILTNYCKWKGLEVNTDQLTYTDLADIPDWAGEGVGFCTAKGWLTGYPEGSFLPQKTATRAEAATVLYKGSGSGIL